MVWNVFEYNQDDTINGSVALSPYGDGACLALAMKWCVGKKRGVSSLHYKGLIATEQQKVVIAGWMNQVQDAVLADLFNGGKFRYYASGEAVSDPSSVRGRLNNLQAYAHRLEKMSQWARSEGLGLLDDKVGFPAGAGGWVAALINAAFTRTSSRIIGLIAITGSDEGHAFGYEYIRTPYERISFFDPNHGEFRSTSRQEFETWFSQLVNDDYDDLNQHWWVVQFH